MPPNPSRESSLSCRTGASSLVPSLSHADVGQMLDSPFLNIKAYLYELMSMQDRSGAEKELRGQRGAKFLRVIDQKMGSRLEGLGDDESPGFRTGGWTEEDRGAEEEGAGTEEPSRKGEEYERSQAGGTFHKMRGS